MFQKQITDIQFLVFTMLVVVALGAKTFASLIEPDDQVSGVAFMSSDFDSTPKRSPSSVGSHREIQKTQLNRFAKHDLNCKKAPTESILAIEGGFVQFQGKHCLKIFKTSELEIVNRKNGFTASIFASGSDQYQTDLIQLEKGDNEIAIRYRESSGAVVEEVVKVRSNRI